MKPEFSAIKEKCFVSFLYLVYILLTKRIEHSLSVQNLHILPEVERYQFFIYKKRLR